MHAAAGHLRADLALAQQQVRSRLESVGPGTGPDAGAALPAVQRAVADAGRLSSATGSLPFAVAARLPLVGDDVRTVRAMALDADRLGGQLAPVLLGVVSDLQDAPRGAPLDLRPLTTRAGAVRRAAREVAAEDARLRRYRPRTSAVRQARTTFAGQLDALGAALRPVADVAGLAAGMTGQQGARRYLVVLQTPAESRATGGLVGGFVELVVDRGQVEVVRQGSNADLHDQPRDVLLVGGGDDEAWGSWGAERAWRESNLSPDFPSVAQVWAALYRAQFGVQVDGVVGVTPEALAGLLGSRPPVVLTDGTRVTAADVVPLLERGIYQRFPTYAQEQQRNAYQQQILSALVQAVPAATRGALPALRSAVANGSLRLASLHVDEQVDLEATALGGALSTAPGPFCGWTTQNASASKLDVYLTRRSSYERQPATQGEDRTTATLTLRNDAPASGLPDYVLGRLRPTGTDVVLVSNYMTAGAQLVSVTVDGRPVQPLVRTERGHPLATLSVTLPPAGGSATVVVVSREPASTARVMTLVQPGVPVSP